MSRAFLLITSALWLAFPIVDVVAQSSLQPPGGPAPDTKRLDQVEPRTIVNAANCPGNDANLFIISQPGSYYVTGNIAGERGRNGILIEADDVSVNFNGFAVRGVAGSGVAILTTAPRRGVRIANATIADWPGGAIIILGKGARGIGNWGSVCKS